MNRVERNTDDKINTAIKDSIIKYKVSIVRNYESVPFSESLTNEQKDIFEDELIKYLMKRKKNFTVCRIEDLGEDTKCLLKGNGLINAEIEKNQRLSIAYNNETVILFNYINHLTIISSSSQLGIGQLYKKAKDIELKLGGFSTYLVSPKYGFMSPLLFDCGMGFKITASVHLSGIARSNKFEQLKENVFERGYNIEKWELNSDKSDFFEISSRLNYGLSEDDLIERFEIGIRDLLEIEKEFLSNYYYDNKNIDDEIFRSYGILRYARKLTKDEIVTHISNMRTGIKLKLDLPIDIDMINKMQSALFSTSIDTIARSEKCSEDNVRASLVRTFMEDSNV